MKIQLEIIDPVRYPGWDELLLSQQDYSFFHSSQWARVLQESYRYRPLYFSSIDAGRISMLIPLMEVSSVLTGKRAVGLPFTDYCEPVVNEKESCSDVLDHLVRFGKRAGWDSIEIRSGNGFAQAFPSSSSYSVHTLDLSPGPDALLKKFRDTTQRNIRKAVREGVTVDILTSEDAMNAFCRLNCETRKEHGLPPQPAFFFKKLHEHVIARGKGVVALASLRGRQIAGAVYLQSREKTIYKYGASLRSYQNVRANNLVMWEAIQWCAGKGQKSLCFGRTELENTGLRQFKAGWTGDERIISYCKYDIRKAKFVAETQMGMGRHTALLKRMPMPLLKIAGRILYRHVG